MTQKKIRLLVYGFIISMFIGLFVGMCSTFKFSHPRKSAKLIDDKCPKNIIQKPDDLRGKLFEIPIKIIKTK